MKKEIFTKAIQNLQNLTGQLLENDSPLFYDIPSLDFVMGATKMSETDRMFYEAYKKYGHRTHTWQYFKEMFHGDVENMQKTVKHWKTWDEINKDAHKRYDSNDKELDDLTTVNYWEITNASERKPTQIYEVGKTSETQDKLQQTLFPMSVYQNYLIYTPEIDDLHIGYCEAAREIATDDTQSLDALRKKYIYELHNLLDFDNDNGKFVLYERINAYRKIIFENPDLLYMADKFDLLTKAEKLNFAQIILNKSAEIFGVPTYKVIPIFRKHLQKYTGLANHQKRVFELSTGLQSENFSLYEFLKLLVHEDAHRIDFYNPNQGLLGAQMQVLVSNFDLYDNQGDIYYKNPTEASSFYLESVSGIKLASEIENHKLANKIRSPFMFIKNIFSRH